MVPLFVIFRLRGCVYGYLTIAGRVNNLWQSMGLSCMNRANQSRLYPISPSGIKLPVDSTFCAPRMNMEKCFPKLYCINGITLSMIEPINNLVIIRVQ